MTLSINKSFSLKNVLDIFVTSYCQWNEITGHVSRFTFTYFKNFQAKRVEAREMKASNRINGPDSRKFLKQSDLHWLQMTLSHPICSIGSLAKRKMTCFCCFKESKMGRRRPWCLFCAVKAPAADSQTRADGAQWCPNLNPQTSAYSWP